MTEAEILQYAGYWFLAYTSGWSVGYLKLLVKKVGDNI